MQKPNTHQLPSRAEIARRIESIRAELNELKRLYQLRASWDRAIEAREARQ